MPENKTKPNELHRLALAAMLAAGSTSAAAEFSAAFEYRHPMPMQVSGPGNAPESPAPAETTLTLDSSELPTATVGEFYDFDFRALLSIGGNDPPVMNEVSWVIQNLQGYAAGAGPGLSGDGLLAWTPAEVGTANFEVVASHASTEARQSFTITVNPEEPLFVDTSPNAWLTTGVTFFDGKFYASKYNGANSSLQWESEVYSSPDRKNWSLEFSNTAWIRNIRAAGSKLFAITRVQNSEYLSVLFSSNGTGSTTGIPTPSSTAGVFPGLPAYRDGRYAVTVIICSLETGSESLRLYVSSNGYSWTNAANVSTGGSFCNTKPSGTIATPLGFVTTTVNNTHWFSADGVTWQKRTNAQWPSGTGTWDGNRLLIANGSTSALFASEDLTTTTQISTPFVPTNVSYSAGVYVISNATQMAYGTDLTNWTTVSGRSYQRNASNGEDWIFSTDLNWKQNNEGGEVWHNTRPLR